MHETQKQLRRLVHEARALELKAPLSVPGAADTGMTSSPWMMLSGDPVGPAGIQGAIQAAAPRVAAELEKSLRPWLGTRPLVRPALGLREARSPWSQKAMWGIDRPAAGGTVECLKIRAGGTSGCLK